MSPKAAPEFQLDAARSLRDAIVAGRYKPGASLPSYSELLRLHPYSKRTLQLAIGLLKRQGFIVSEERKGLFVNPAPPHLTRYGFAMPVNEELSYYWRCLSAEFPGIVKERAGEPVIFREVQSVLDGEGDRVAMLEDAVQQRLAGVVFSYKPLLWPELSQTPQVALSCIDYSGGGRVDLDGVSFARQAIGWMRERGRKRIAVLGYGNAPIFDSTCMELGRAGYDVPLAWRLVTTHLASVNAITQLLMSQPKAVRPDGIIVVDDEVAEHVCAGLNAKSVVAGREVEVLSHVNWPWPTVAKLPVRRLGFDMRDSLRRSLDFIDSVRQGRACETLKMIPAIFEEAVAPSVNQLAEIPRSGKAI